MMEICRHGQVTTNEGGDGWEGVVVANNVQLFVKSGPKMSAGIYSTGESKRR